MAIFCCICTGHYCSTICVCLSSVRNIFHLFTQTKTKTGT